MKHLSIMLTDAMYNEVINYKIEAPTQIIEAIRHGKEYRLILDKIRAEIADLDDADYDYEGYYKAVTDAVKIIDKYKAESEGKE